MSRTINHHRPINSSCSPSYRSCNSCNPSYRSCNSCNQSCMNCHFGCHSCASNSLRLCCNNSYSSILSRSNNLVLHSCHIASCISYCSKSLECMSYYCWRNSCCRCSSNSFGFCYSSSYSSSLSSGKNLEWCMSCCSKNLVCMSY